MAYMQFGAIDAAPSNPAPVVARQTAKSKPGFSALEWSVIALAQKDSVSSLHESGPISRAMAALFGARHSNLLADERLEALRRTSVLAWHSSAPLPGDELRAFLAAGFTRGQYDLLLDSVARGRMH